MFWSGNFFLIVLFSNNYILLHKYILIIERSLVCIESTRSVFHNSGCKIHPARIFLCNTLSCYVGLSPTTGLSFRSLFCNCYFFCYRRATLNTAFYKSDKAGENETRLRGGGRLVDLQLCIFSLHEITRLSKFTNS